jgi:hypothetical protein
MLGPLQLGSWRNIRESETAITSLQIISATNGMTALLWYRSRGSRAHSGNQIVGFLLCCVCPHTAAPQHVLMKKNATGMIALGSFTTRSCFSRKFLVNILASSRIHWETKLGRHCRSYKNRPSCLKWPKASVVTLNPCKRSNLKTMDVPSTYLLLGKSLAHSIPWMVQYL